MTWASRTLKHAVIAVVITLMALWSLVPIVWIVTTSFKTKVQALAQPPALFFRPTLENYGAILSQDAFLRPLLNSLLVSSVGTVLALALGSMAAYALARWHFKRSSDVQFWVLSTYMVPPIIVIIPFFMLWSSIRLLNNYVSLIVTYVMLALPFVIWIMIRFFSGIPLELDDAAKIDGCNDWDVFIRIALPLAGPGLVAAGVITLLTLWNEFLFALVLTGAQTRTIPVVIAQFITPTGTLWGQITAAGTIAMVPQLVFLIFMQRYLVRGLTLGAVD